MVIQHVCNKFQSSGLIKFQSVLCSQRLKLGFNIRIRIYPDNPVIREKIIVSGYFHPNTRILSGYIRVIRIKFQYLISG